MNRNEDSLKDSFDKEIKKINQENILSPTYRRKKTIIWGIRTIIAIILFVIFWEYSWVRWVLLAYIPLNIFSLISIHLGSKLLNKKINKTRMKIDELEEKIKEEEALND